MDLGLHGQPTLYDDALMGILQNCGKLQPFLDAVFSFLARRTDFYILMHHDKAKMGFPPGVAESMVMQAFKRYEILTRKREAEIMREVESKKVEEMTSIATNEDELPIVVPDEEEKEKGVESSKQGAEPKPVAMAQAQVGEPKHLTKKDLEEYQSKKERAMAFNETSDTFNGAEMENYKWSQTITELELKVFLPEGTSGKDVRVDIRSDHLKVEVLKPEYQLVLDGPLLNRVKVEDSMWNVDRENSTLCINLEKTKEIMWKSVLEGEEGIDLTKVDNTRDISEFDTEAQAAIQRVTYDQHMKMQGKPTSSEKKAHEILKKAWNAEGSPFKGTPFDPSRVQISGTW